MTTTTHDRATVTDSDGVEYASVEERDRVRAERAERRRGAARARRVLERLDSDPRSTVELVDEAMGFWAEHDVKLALLADAVQAWDDTRGSGWGGLVESALRQACLVGLRRDVTVATTSSCPWGCVAGWLEVVEPGGKCWARFCPEHEAERHGIQVSCARFELGDRLRDRGRGRRTGGSRLVAAGGVW